MCSYIIIPVIEDHERRDTNLVHKLAYLNIEYDEMLNIIFLFQNFEGLLQKERRKKKISGGDMLTIGYTIYKVLHPLK